MMNFIKRNKKQNKLKGIPKIYYFNLDCDVDRKKFMEDQFNNYGLDYERVSQSCYTSENFYDWVTKFEDYEYLKDIVMREEGFNIPANFLRHMEFMKKWLCDTSEEYLLVMEDDYDLSLIDYWHFDWNYLLNNLPFDWEAIKLNDDNRFKIKFFLHPHGDFRCPFGAMLFKRSFVKKIVSLYYNNNGTIKSYDKRSLNMRFSSDIDKYSVDITLGNINNVYIIPLFTTEASLCTNKLTHSSIHVFGPIQRACHQWWRNERDCFTLEDFFTFYKPNDDDMTLWVNTPIL